MPAKRLQEFLDSHNVKYVTISHSMAFTAIDIAKSAHVPTKEMAKIVVIKLAGGYGMVVLPASYRVDLEILKEAFKTEDVELAGENEFSRLFPDCEVGAMPPFGNLYDMDVYLAEPLTENEDIAFNAGSHSEILKMAYSDFERLVKPKLVVLTGLASHHW